MQSSQSSHDSKSSITVLVGMLLCLAVTQARGEGLDLANPTPREITVAFENSGPDVPGALNQKYGEPVRGWFVAGPVEGQATVRILGSEMESVISNYEPVPGSFSDYVWIFDVETGHVVSASFAGVVKSKVDWGFFDTEVETSIVMDMGTRSPAGFLEPEERFGHIIFAYCEEKSAGCQHVEPAPLDHQTGYVNAVGSVLARAIGGLETRSYSPMGEALFQESERIPTVSAGP